MSKHLAYLHSIWFTQKNLSSIFENDSDYENFFNSLSFESLSKLKLKDEKIFELMENYKKTDYTKIDSILKTRKIKVISYNDLNYPALLKNIPNPPFVIYIRWELSNDKNLLSIVGSRKNTRYSQVVLEKFIPDLIKSGFWVVSWWAFWVDSLAHNITLKNWWYTIAVIGTWIDNDYPASNKALYENIIDARWAVLSIFRIWTWPDSYNFPIRNEIIAWLSLGTLITEAWEGSWTLITANLALELNRDIFVIPWEINKETSSWANRLIRDWLGKLVIESEDILNEYNINLQKQEKIKEISFSDEIEKMIFEQLKTNPLDASSIADILWIDIEIIWYKLTILEINWIIELWDWWNYNIK